MDFLDWILGIPEAIGYILGSGVFAAIGLCGDDEDTEYTGYVEGTHSTKKKFCKQTGQWEYFDDSGEQVFTDDDGNEYYQKEW